MTATYDRPLRLQTPPGSPRVRMAQLAQAVALGVPGVLSTDSGPARLFVTASDRQRVDGVRCVSAVDGGYEVSLRLCCELVPLPALGEAVRAAVARAARSAGITVAEINVCIADVAQRGPGR
jgi:hypothetical protein